MNELGRRLSRELNIEKIIEAKWSTISALLKERLKDDCNSYDIQEACFELGRKYSTLTTSVELEKIKEQAYQTGRSLSDFDLLFGIVVRNKYFKDHGHTLSDIDNHDLGASLSNATT